MSEPNTNLTIIQTEPIISLINTNLPQMQRSSSLAVDAMKKMKPPTTDDEYEENNQMLVRVKATYDTIYPLRKAITDMFDAAKDALMEYERPLDYGSKAKSLYHERRKWQEDYQQAKVEAQRKAAAEAARIKAVEDFKVDIKAAVQTNLTSLITAKVKQADITSQKFMAESTLETWDERMKQFKGWTPKLSEADYNACFNVANRPDLLKPMEYDTYIQEIKNEEPYTKWNETIVTQALPVINEWRAKIPALKQELVAKKNAKSDEERLELERKQKEKADQEAAARQAEIDRQARENQERIEQEAQANRLKNSFQEQALVQQAEDAGPTKKVLKFVDMKEATPLIEIIIHCLSHPKFGGIQKKDKKGKLVFDDKGRPEYVDEVQKWINFFLSNCDAHIKGTLVTEDAKVIVKK